MVEKICDKICIIAKGKLVGEWKISELAEQGVTLEELYMKYVYLAARTQNDYLTEKDYVQQNENACAVAA